MCGIEPDTIKRYIRITHAVLSIGTKQTAITTN